MCVIMILGISDKGLDSAIFEKEALLQKQNKTKAYKVSGVV